MTRKRYPSDLTNAQWAKIADEIPPAKLGGRPRTTDMREVVNAILYIARSGAPWGMLPHDFPPPKTVYHYFRSWSEDGTLESLHDKLVSEVRQKTERAPNPSVAIIDSQSVKSTEKGGLGAMMRERG